MPDEHVNMIRGLIGMSSSIFAVGITLTELEQQLRVAGAIVGLAIGLLTLVAMLFKGK